MLANLSQRKYICLIFPFPTPLFLSLKAVLLIVKYKYNKYLLYLSIRRKKNPEFKSSNNISRKKSLTNENWKLDIFNLYNEDFRKNKEDIFFSLKAEVTSANILPMQMSVDLKITTVLLCQIHLTMCDLLVFQ